MNTRLLRKIAKVIQEKPKEFDIGHWHREKKSKKVVGMLASLPPERRVCCNTTHCIAGWAQVLSPERNLNQFALDDGRRLLNLTPDQSARLFYAQGWPRGFGGQRATPAQTAARIEHFIKTKGAE